MCDEVVGSSNEGGGKERGGRERERERSGVYILYVANY